jgi:hypothetical protein
MRMSSGSVAVPSATLEPQLPRPGDYLCSDRALYQVERVLGDHALIEDCRTEALIEVTIDELLALRPVRPASTS